MFGLVVFGLLCGFGLGFYFKLFVCVYIHVAAAAQDTWKRRRIDELQLDTGRELRVDALTELFAPDSLERNRNVMNPDARWVKEICVLSRNAPHARRQQIELPRLLIVLRGIFSK
jgi:hypothetical protein